MEEGMSDAGLVVLGWCLGVVSTAGASVIRWVIDCQRKKKMQTVVELFRSGTRLRNRGQRLSTQIEQDDWQAEWKTWHKDLERAVDAADPIRGANVTNLVNFPLLNFSDVDPKLQHLLSQLTETLQRLQVFISS
jgi:hypothetical protein